MFCKETAEAEHKCLQTEATARLTMLTKADNKPLSRTEVPSSQAEECTQIYIYIYIDSCAHKCTCPLQNMQNVNNLNKIRGIMKIACYCLFNTVLNKLFHITDVYIFSTRQNNNWIYKNDPVQKFTHPWILILCVISWMIHDCFSVLW